MFLCNYVMEITKLYLCESTVVIIRFNQALLEHNYNFFSNESSELIFICEACRSFFKQIYFLQNFCFKEVRKCLLEEFLESDRIQENNLMEHNKKKFLKGEIIFTHCRGHDTIMIHFLFEGFYDQHIRLLSRSYYFR